MAVETSTKEEATKTNTTAKTQTIEKKHVPKHDAGARSRGRRGGKDRRDEKPEDEFDQKIIDLARVTRVMKGGKRMRFRAAVAIGDHKGTIGFALAKGADVSLAISKAARRAKKDLLTVTIKNETIPHEVRSKYKAADILLKPSAKGRGVKAGGAMRVILELAGIPNVTGKMLGSPNKVNTSRATLKALASLTKKKKQ